VDTVIFVPGSLGSQLFAQTLLGRVKIWINPIQLAAHGFLKLNLDDPGETGKISVGGVVEPIYQKLLNRLSAVPGFNVLPFPYDWRQNVEVSAAALSSLFQAQVPTSDNIHIITHSLGGMVVRRAVQMLSNVPGMATRIGRIVMIAPANQGCYVAAYGIAATTRHIPLLNLFPNPSPAMQAVTRSFPSLYQTLPFDDHIFPSLGVNDVRTTSWWRVPVHSEYVALANFQASIDVPALHSKMAIIIGLSVSNDTPAGVQWIDGKMEPLGDPIDGDGYVPHISSAMPGVLTFISPHSGHLELPKDQNVIQACIDIISGIPVTSLNSFP
jgi:pimeloyl-ACP methyl ester carboxylesterase